VICFLLTFSSEKIKVVVNEKRKEVTRKNKDKGEWNDE